ncbi:MAG: hypothetical protein FVQ85_02995 [Planctomycetes bacterium]|nr:hypothetical protein [Planctomycetota bacterium]
MAKQNRMLIRKLNVTQLNEEEYELVKQNLNIAIGKIRRDMLLMIQKRTQREEKQKERDLIQRMKEQSEEGRKNRYAGHRQLDTDKARAAGTGEDVYGIQQKREQAEAARKQKEEDDKWRKDHPEALIVDEDSSVSSDKPTVD